MNNGVEKERDCKDCGEPIAFSDHDVTASCGNCGQEYEVVADAEFEDGLWRDRTYLAKATVHTPKGESKSG